MVKILELTSIIEDLYMKCLLILCLTLLSSCITTQQEHEQRWREAKIQDLKNQKKQGLITEADYNILTQEVYRYQN